MILTSQMLRDKIDMYGPMSLWDIETTLKVKTDADRRLMLSVIHEALLDGVISIKTIQIENEKHSLYTSEGYKQDWSDS